MRYVLIAALSLPLLLGGCGNEENSAALDEAAIAELMESEGLFDLNAHFEGTAVDDSGTTDTTLAAKDSIVPFLWGRKVTGHPEVSAEIDIVNDSAFVSYSVNTVGNLNILAWDPDTGWVGIQKPFGENSQLFAIFKRTGSIGSTHRGWVLTDISGAEGESDPVFTVRIDSVRIQSASYPDTVLTEPLDIFSLTDVITFTSGEVVTLTTYTNDSTLRVFLHVFMAYWPWHIRVPFTNGGDGSYTGTWHAQLIPAVRFAVFDCLQYETLHDDTHPYDFNGWLFPYAVVLP
jgi:hypothetical protein